MCSSDLLARCLSYQFSSSLLASPLHHSIILCLSSLLSSLSFAEWFHLSLCSRGRPYASYPERLSRCFHRQRTCFLDFSDPCCCYPRGKRSQGRDTVQCLGPGKVVASDWLKRSISTLCGSHSSASTDDWELAL